MSVFVRGARPNKCSTLRGDGVVDGCRWRYKGSEAGAMAEQGQMAETMAEETSKLVERAASAKDDAKNAQAEALFGPGYAQPGVPGLAGREGMPRPRGTEQTSFEQLRNLAAMYDGVQLCERDTAFHSASQGRFSGSTHPGGRRRRMSAPARPLPSP